MRADVNGRRGEPKKRVGVVVRGGADVVVLRDDDVAADGDRGEVINLGVDAKRRALAHGQFPRHPYLYAAIDEACRSNPGSEEAKKRDAQRAERAWHAGEKRKLKERPEQAQEFFARRRWRWNAIEVDAQRTLDGVRGGVEPVGRLGDGERICAGVGHQSWSLPRRGLAPLVYNRREPGISVGEVRLRPSLPDGPAEGRYPHMIRFLQKDNRLVKSIFIVIIGAAVITMVITLIPGIFQNVSNTADTFATVYPHWYSRLLFEGDTISVSRVQEIAQQQLQRQRLPDFYLQLMVPRVGQQLVMQRILLFEAARLGIGAGTADVSDFLHKGQYGELLFPGGKFVGMDKYSQFIRGQFGISTAEFEKELREDITIQRLRAYITAGVTVSDAEVRDTYRKQNIKIKFDYAVIEADDLRKQINPTDAELQAFFTKNAARYASAVPEQRTITYFAFTADQVPGGVPQVSQQEIQQYYTEHMADYQTPEQARSRHILIKFPGGAAKTDAEAKAKAESILKQLQGGADFATLAKKYSEDPGSAAQGGELGFAKHGTMVPEFDKAIFTQPIGALAIVKTQYGYHIVQVEERQSAHTQPLNEVLPTIQVSLIREKESKAEAAYAQSLTDEAAKNGLAKTAAAHKLALVTTPPVGVQGIIAGLPDSTELLGKAFIVKQGAPPAFAPTGEGYAIFQVTGITPAHAPKFEEYKATIAKDYADERLPQLLQEKTKELADKAHADNDLNKAAKEVGATVKSSDLVGETGQVPDLGQISTVAPELLNLNVGQISGPINAQRTGVVAKITDKQTPSDAEIAKNFDQTRDQILDQRREEVFGVFVNSAQDRYKKANLISLNPSAMKSMNLGQ